MKKIGWFMTILGVIVALSAVLYPLGLVSKVTCLYLLLGGAGCMFIGSMIRAFSLLKKQNEKHLDALLSWCFFCLMEIIFLYLGNNVGKRKAAGWGAMNNNQLKNAQQHLANERTFLAWIRSAIAIIGVGFLTTSLHFTIGTHRDHLIDLISIILGLFACFIGLFITVSASIGYFQKKRQINDGSFIPSSVQIVFIAVFMILMLVMIILYFLFVKFKQMFNQV